MDELMIDGRKVDVVSYAMGRISINGLEKMDALKIDVSLNDSDCPERKCLEERLTCGGDCQNSYLAIFLKGKEIEMKLFGGTVHGWERISTCDYAERMGIDSIEGLYNFLNGKQYQVFEDRGVETCVVDGRALFRMVSKDHCSFICPINDSDGVKERLINEKRSTLEYITKNFLELLKIARPATQKDYLELGLREVGEMVSEETRKKEGHTYIERIKTKLYGFF